MKTIIFLSIVLMLSSGVFADDAENASAEVVESSGSQDSVKPEESVSILDEPTFRESLRKANFVPQAGNDPKVCPLGKINLFKNQIDIYSENKNGMFFGTMESFGLKDYTSENTIHSHTPKGDKICTIYSANEFSEASDSMSVVGNTTEDCGKDGTTKYFRSLKITKKDKTLKMEIIENNKTCKYLAF